jgi:hypothetical protein
MTEHLPAVVLPNLDNQQDAAAVLSNGQEIFLSELLRSLHSAQHLRFMIQSSDPKSARDPRVTWQRQQGDRVLIVAAFAADTDSHERVVSASVIFELKAQSSLPRKLIDRLGATNAKDLKKFFAEHLNEVRAEINNQLRQGLTGGECDLKKKFVPLSGRSYDGSP